MVDCAMAGGHVFRRSAFLVLPYVLFRIFKLCSSKIPSIISASSNTALDMHKIKLSKLNVAYFFWGSRGSASLQLFRVKSGLRLVQATQSTIVLILIAGDVSRNPGPMDIFTAEMNYAAEIEKYLNNLVVIPNRLNYSRSFAKPETHHLLKFPLFMINAKMPAEI